MDYTPKVSRDDVLRIIKRDYPLKDRDTILDMLKEYGTEPSHSDSHRVHLAILKLGVGDTNQLKQFIDEAKSDFRVVIDLAERTLFLEFESVGPSNTSPQELTQQGEEDWRRYQEWLNAK